MLLSHSELGYPFEFQYQFLHKQHSRSCSFCLVIQLYHTLGILKDNPALSEKAASSQRAEYQFMSERSQTERRVDPSVGALQTPVSTNLQQSILMNDVPTKSQYKATGLTSTVNVEEESLRCQEVIHKKITWARYALESEHDPNMVSSYMKVITSGVEAINVLRKFSP
uniref:Sjoegren syndrome/scleroderma autoantigen n=1 Tax=Daphnia magna TaxID=35525 RepID=A0A0P5FMJ2_9CRUS